MAAEKPGYFAADAEAGDELARLQMIESELDPHTFGRLDSIGVGAGWWCLEVGAGAGSVVRWLSERVGASGRVVAADIDPRFIADLSAPNLEVRRCDITRDDVEPDSYDLVHSRLLLQHLDDPADVLRRMAAALRPGGWLVAEEFDSGIVGAADPAHPLAEVFDSTWRKWVQFLKSAGIMDPYFGRVLPAQVQALGLDETGNAGVTRVLRGGEPFSRWWILSWRILSDAMVAAGADALPESEFADMRRAFSDPTFNYRGYVMQSVWGRKPT